MKGKDGIKAEYYIQGEHKVLSQELSVSSNNKRLTGQSTEEKMWLV